MTQAFYIEASPLGDGQDLVVTGDWTTDAVAALGSPEVDGLTLNYARGFREPSLDFLDAWPLRRLNVLDRKLKDLTPIYRLAATLQDLSVQSGPGSDLDLTRLPRLTRLERLGRRSGTHSRGCPTLRACS